jgi:hypothetical protein
MSDRDKMAFTEGEEEEFHVTDEDIDRELAAMDVEQSYQSSEDVSSAAGLEKPSIKQRLAAFKQLKRKHWIIIAIVVIILLFGLLKLVGGGSQSQASFGQITPVPALSNKGEPVTQRVESDLTKADLTKAVFEPSVSPKTEPVMTAPTLSTSSVAINHNQLKTDLTTIASNETKLTQVLEAVQKQNQILTQQMTELSGRVVGLESTLNQSTQTVEGLSQQVVTLKKKQIPAKLSPLPQLAQSLPEAPQYTVEAVVPQRAWLQTGDGSTVTVMIGDDIPGLGAVVSIDPYSGNVTTASGTVIKYGS